MIDAETAHEGIDLMVRAITVWDLDSVEMNLVTSYTTYLLRNKMSTKEFDKLEQYVNQSIERMGEMSRE